MFDDEHNSDSGQEQNYDYIFEALEKRGTQGTKETFTSGDILISDSDGNVQKATVPSVIKVFAPSLIFAVLLISIGVVGRINGMLSVMIMGLMFMGVAVWKSFTAEKKFRPHPVMIIICIMGISMVYSSAAELIYQKNPFFDMSSFRLYSILGLGIGIMLCGIVMLAISIWKMKTCSTQITARCTKIQRVGYRNGRAFGSVTWTYEYEGVPYTGTVYNIMLTTFDEGVEEQIFVDPAHPGRIRCKGLDPLLGWAIGFTIFGMLLIGGCIAFDLFYC